MKCIDVINDGHTTFVKTIVSQTNRTSQYTYQINKQTGLQYLIKHGLTYNKQNLFKKSINIKNKVYLTK